MTDVHVSHAAGLGFDLETTGLMSDLTRCQLRYPDRQNIKQVILKEKQALKHTYDKYCN